MLRVHDLTRVYGEATVLDRVSFDVRPGRMTGFVGANGAGKTTTMRIIVGVLAATAGSVTWDGDPLDADVRRTFGYMPEERGLYPKMRVLDQLVYFARLHGFTASEAEARARELMGRLGIEDRAGDILETLSLGNQQRVQIAVALVHRPVALILDEPFSGLDPIAVDTMASLLRDEVSDEVPVLFSSHQLELVERLCDDLVILSHGRLVAAGSVEELRRDETSRFRLTLARAEDSEEVRRMPELSVLDVTGAQAIVELNGTPPEVVLRSLTDAVPVREFTRVVRPLSEIYKEAVR